MIFRAVRRMDRQSEKKAKDYAVSLCLKFGCFEAAIDAFFS
jgi:hypothetical protein